MLNCLNDKKAGSRVTDAIEQGGKEGQIYTLEIKLTNAKTSIQPTEHVYQYWNKCKIRKQNINGMYNTQKVIVAERLLSIKLFPGGRVKSLWQ